jgi:hypothetical protein
MGRLLSLFFVIGSLVCISIYAFLFLSIENNFAHKLGFNPTFARTGTGTKQDEDSVIKTASKEKNGKENVKGDHTKLKCGTGLYTMTSDVDLSDAHKKLRIMASPKGGATLATQIMFRKLGLMEKAIAYSPYSWIHEYRSKVFMKEHPLVPCQQSCGSDWLCIKIVRSPLDRIVSSYIHVMLYKVLYFPELVATVKLTGKQTEDASFADFVNALVLRGEGKEARSFADNHFTPQSTLDACDDVVHLLPTESIEDGLSAIYNISGVALNATGMSSFHYIVKDKSLGEKLEEDLSHVPFLSRGQVSAPYGAYLRNATLNAEICRLFCNDIALYAKACSSHLLRARSETQKVCSTERLRVLSICGPGYDFFLP